MSELKKTEELIVSGFSTDKDLNCAETVLGAANETYGWKLRTMHSCSLPGLEKGSADRNYCAER